MPNDEVIHTMWPLATMLLTLVQERTGPSRSDPSNVAYNDGEQALSGSHQ